MKDVGLLTKGEKSAATQRDKTVSLVIILQSLKAGSQ